jgi:hypothetical protein
MVRWADRGGGWGDWSMIKKGNFYKYLLEILKELTPSRQEHY